LVLFLHHLFLLLHLHLGTLGDHALILLPSIFDAIGSLLVLAFPNLGSNSAILSFHFDASCLQGDTHEMALILHVSLLDNQQGTLESSFL